MGEARGKRPGGGSRERIRGVSEAGFQLGFSANKFMADDCSEYHHN